MQQCYPYPAPACILASAAATLGALRSICTGKSCTSHPAGSWLMAKKDMTLNLTAFYWWILVINNTFENVES